MKDIHKNDRVVALLAGAMAIISLSVAIWDGIETRHHNRLSVKPFLSFDHSTKSSTITNDQNITTIKSRSTITVVNKGLGPANIKSFKIITFIADKKVVHTDWFSALKALNNSQENSQTGTLDANSVLRADDSVLLVTLDTSKKTTSFLQIEIVYQSFYEEEFIAKTDRIEL